MGPFLLSPVELFFHLSKVLLLNPIALQASDILQPAFFALKISDIASLRDSRLILRPRLPTSNVELFFGE